MTELANAYFRLFHRKRDYQWAEDTVEKVFEQNSASALAMTLELIDSAPSIETLEHVGAMQLQKLCSLHGKEIFDQLKEAAQNNNRLFYAMKQFYLDKDNAIYSEYNAFVVEQSLHRDPARLLNLPERLGAIQ